MFVDEPEQSPHVRAMYDDDVEADGYVNNLTRLWAWVPDADEASAAARAAATAEADLPARDIAVLVVASASARADAYCSLAWGTRLAGLSGASVAATVLAGVDEGTDDRCAALAHWARRVVTDPNATTPADVDRLRATGLSDRQVVAATVFVAQRMAFSTVNAALGAAPDCALAAAAPPAVRDAVEYGRSPAPQ